MYLPSPPFYATLILNSVSFWSSFFGDVGTKFLLISSWNLFIGQENANELVEHDETSDLNAETDATKIRDVDESIFQQCAVNEGIVMCDEEMACTQNASDAVIYSDDWCLLLFMDNKWRLHICQSQVFFNLLLFIRPLEGELKLFTRTYIKYFL